MEGTGANLMLKMFSIEYDYVTHPLPPGWIEPFATGDLALAEPGYRYKDDGSGDSIARLHSAFSEFVAHYWVWKNLPKTEYIGFCHYRRFFNFMKIPQINLAQLNTPATPEILQFVNQQEQKDRALEILQTWDGIAPKQISMPISIHEQYCDNHPPYIWDEFIRVIQHVSPPWLSKYVPLFELSREFQIVPIFILRWEIFEEYCALLFDVLFLVFKNIGPLAEVEGARFQPRRYSAFLAERFLMLYFHAKGLRLFGTQIIMLDGALRPRA